MLRIESHLPQVRHGEGQPTGSTGGGKGTKQPAPTAGPMEVQEPVEEATLEDQILELESRVKFLRGEKDAWAKQHLEAAEVELKALQEKQKKASRLPARLQAATDRLAKFTATDSEDSSRVDHQDKLGKTSEELAEVVAKRPRPKRSSGRWRSLRPSALR